MDPVIALILARVIGCPPRAISLQSRYISVVSRALVIRLICTYQANHSGTWYNYYMYHFDISDQRIASAYISHIALTQKVVFVCSSSLRVFQSSLRSSLQSSFQSSCVHVAVLDEFHTQKAEVSELVCISGFYSVTRYFIRSFVNMGAW